MKLITRLFFFVLLFNVNTSHSQDMTAISETGTWIVFNSYPQFGWDPNTNSYQWFAVEEWAMYKTGGDTIINGTTYKQLLFWPLSYDMSTGEYSTWGNGVHRLAYRNDNALRAYRVDYGETTEELWYDFNLQVGDSIEAANQPVAFFPTKQYIIGVDSVEFCDSTYKQFHYGYLPTSSMPSDQRTAQRIGSLWNLIEYNWTTSQWYELTYFCESPVNLEDIVTIKETTIPSISIYPNPAKDNIHIDGIAKEQTYQIIGMDGRVLQEGFVIEYIAVQNLHPGTYQLYLPELGAYSRFIKQ